MTLIYRHQKGSALTIEEMDGNFQDLNERLRHFEKGPLLAEGIASITQRGDQLRILGTHGSDFGLFRLPRLIPCLRGEWKLNETYEVANFVWKQGDLHLCLVTHVSQNWTDECDADVWQKILTGGEDEKA